MAKSSGGGGRSGRGRVAAPVSQGGLASIMRDRQTFRTSASAPTPRQLGRFQLSFAEPTPQKNLLNQVVGHKPVGRNLGTGKRGGNLATVEF